MHATARRSCSPRSRRPLPCWRSGRRRLRREEGRAGGADALRQGGRSERSCPASTTLFRSWSGPTCARSCASRGAASGRGATSTGKVSFSILSGDANLFEADVALQYRIGNLKSYLYATVDPEAVLTLIVRERLIEIMGKHFIDLIFTTNRDDHPDAPVQGHIRVSEGPRYRHRIAGAQHRGCASHRGNRCRVSGRERRDRRRHSIGQQRQPPDGKTSGPQPGPGGGGRDERQGESAGAPASSREQRQDSPTCWWPIGASRPRSR